VATEALRICHFDPDTGEDLRMAPGGTEECEAACYDCLMTYSNQSHHDQLDRQAVKDLLLQLARSSVHSGPATLPRGEHLQRLLTLCQSGLEKDWLKLLESRNLRLPTDAQKYVYAGKTCPDFVYEGDYRAAIYIDGPHHDYPQRQQRDAEQMEMIEDDGWIVIRFRHSEDWESILAQYPNIFGKREGV
jgi:very-short-patch-repair endonuclease